MKRVAVAAALVEIVASGCSTFEQQGPRAVASLEAAKGNPVWGSVSFVETKNGVLVRADVRGLRSNGEFGRLGRSRPGADRRSPVRRSTSPTCAPRSPTSSGGNSGRPALRRAR